MIVTTDTYESVLASLDTNELIIDVETNGLNPFGGNQICGIGVGTLDGREYYFPIRHIDYDNLSPTKIINYINTNIDVLIGYNIKFDIHFLMLEGLDVTNTKLVDVLVMVRLSEISSIKDLALTPTIKRRYGEKAASYDIETKKILRKNKWFKDFSLTPPDILGPYCEKDVYWTRKLYEDCLEHIQRSEQEDIFSLECDLSKVLLEMEARGILVDAKYAQQSGEKVEKRKQEVSKKIFNLVGYEFNLNSPKQIGEVFKELGITSPVKTAKQQESWNEVALVQIDHQVAGLIRQHRALEKLRSTYLEPYENIDVLHTSFCNWGTLTGRLSSRNPNLQNIPRTHFKLRDIALTDEERGVIKGRVNAIISSKKGGLSGITLSDEVLETWGFVGDESYSEDDTTQVAVRRLFIPRPNYSLVSFDYSQMEVRIFLNYLHNDEMNDLLLKNDVDFHGEAAKIAFAIPEDHSEFKFYRQMAKNITFGVIYGIGSKRLAAQLGKTQKEAHQYKEKYFANIKGSKTFINRVISTVESRGFIKNRYGRVYKLEMEEAYKGVNYLVQGTSADILNERMIKIHEYLRDKNSSLLLQVHDEIICEIHDSEIHTVPNVIKDMLEENSLEIPLTVDVDECDFSWATKHAMNGHFDLGEYIDWD